MKNFSTILLQLLLAVVAIQAQAVSLTVKVNDPEAIILRTQNGYEDLSSGSVTFDVPANSMIMARANEGFELRSVVDKSGQQLDVFNNSWSVVITEASEGEVYTIDAGSQAAKETADFTINIDDASKASASLSSAFEYVQYDLVNGKNTVQFIPSDDAILYVSPTSYTTSDRIYKVTVDGEPAETDGVNWNLKPTAGCVVDIITKTPEDAKADVTFVFTDESRGCLSAVNLDGVPLENFETETLQVGVNKSIELVAAQGYVIEGGMVNGVRFYWNGYYPKEILISENTTISMIAHKVKDVTVTVNVNHADQVKVYPGTAGVEEPFELVDGENVLNIPETVSFINFIVDPESYLVKAEASVGTISYNAVSVVDGLVLTIETEKIVYDKRASVWLDSKPDDSFQFQAINMVSPIQVYEKGYNIMDFYYGLNPFSIAWNSTDPGKVFLNGEALTSAIPGLFLFQNVELADGDVVKIFLKTEPVECKVTLDRSCTPEVKIYRDEIVAVDENQNEVACFAGTKFRIENPSGKMIEVKVNETELKPLEQADVETYEFIVESPATEVVISDPKSGIGSISVDENSAVYNLQGIKVADSLSDALPAGIYIIDGKKVSIR